MASVSFNLFILTLVVAQLGQPIMATARQLGPKTSLAARLKLEGGPDAQTSDCWGSLFQLQSCTGEVIMFFLNGETYLGPSCCHAIRIIQNECWPKLLGSLGYTTEEGDVLESYCDAAAAVDSPPLTETTDIVDPKMSVP